MYTGATGMTLRLEWALAGNECEGRQPNSEKEPTESTGGKRRSHWGAR